MRTISSHPLPGAAGLADQARHGAQHAYDRATAGAASLREHALPAFKRAASSIADGADEIRWVARRASYRGADYVREHPVPAALMVGAAAALVFFAVRAWMLHDR